MLGGQPRGDAGPHGDAGEIDGLELEMVEQREDVVGEGAEPEAVLRAERMPSAVPAAFQADQPPIEVVAARLAHVAAEAVLEDER